MTLDVRQLTRGEMPEAAVVHRMAFDQQLPWLAGRHTPDADRAYFMGPVFDACDVWGAWDGARLLGFIAFREGWIDQLYVLPGAQTLGVGSRLLDVAKRVHGDLRLWTFQRNHRARRFYEARGFVAVEQTDGGRNEEREPDIQHHWHEA
jgi:GNAT superfamily N-acetyltransferase